MVKNYVQLGNFAFIEIPDKEKANKYITESGICRHKWNEDNIEYGFSRYGIHNEFIINFYVAVGLHYHIYNVFVDAIEAECYGVTRTDSAFWEENIAGKGYENENLIKPKTEYVVVKILLTFPLKHISEIESDITQSIHEIYRNGMWSRYNEYQKLLNEYGIIKEYIAFLSGESNHRSKFRI